MIKMISSTAILILISLMNLLLNVLVMYSPGMHPYIGPDHPCRLAGVNLILGLTIFGIALYIIRRTKLVSYSALGLRYSHRHLFYSFCAVIMTVLIFIVYLKSLDEAGILKARFVLYNYDLTRFAPLLTAAGVSWLVTTSFEEFWRASMADHLKKFRPAVIFAALGVISILLHSAAGMDLLYTAVIFMTSSTFLYVYLKSGSILPVAAAHFIYDFTVGNLFGDGVTAILRVEGDLPNVWYALGPVLLYNIMLIVLAKLFYGDASIRLHLHRKGNRKQGSALS